MMERLPELHDDAPAIAHAIVECIKTKRLDEAEHLLGQLHDACPNSRAILVFPVMIALTRGRPREAWQLVNGLPEERCPELKAICLKMLGDPSWHGYATAHEDSPDPYVRKAMRQLLGKTEQ